MAKLAVDQEARSTARNASLRRDRMAAFLDDVRAAGIPVANCTTTGSRLYRQNAPLQGSLKAAAEPEGFTAESAKNAEVK